MIKEKKATVIMANDTGSHSLKEAVKQHLKSLRYDVADFGTQSCEETMTYIEAGVRVSRVICDSNTKDKSEAAGSADETLGLLFCGSGAGVMLTANKHKGTRAVVCESLETAKSARIINNANILCIGANMVKESQAKEMAEIFLSTDFMEGLDADTAAKIEGLAKKLREIEEEDYK